MGVSEKLFERAKRRIPGGVNSPVRAFGSVGMTPRFIARAKGDRVWDADGNEYIDFVGSWGPMILGHAHPAVLEAVERAARDGLSFGAATEREVEMAELLCAAVPNLDMVRMVNSGTEAVMSAIRAARGFTGRDKIVKFSGCYHGHSDALLVKAGSGLMTQGIPGSAGVPEGCTRDTLSAEYNNLESVSALFDANPGAIAAVIVEPVGANMGVVPPAEGFLEGLRRLCDEHGALLIFDEVITGFRLALGGAQEYYGVRADLCTFGKVIGGGMPVGAYGGRRDVMGVVAPLGSVYQAGTLSGNPVAMAAGLAQLKVLRDTPDFYSELNRKSNKFFTELKTILEEAGVGCRLNHAGSLGCVFFTEKPVTDYAAAQTSDTARFSAYFRFMLERGVYLAPSQFEAMFLSAAHTPKDLERTLDAVRAFWKR
ncbi:MAG: glutamate-1-semialdehyde 2,1-aminomutase [Oscillospiraceae bacterium]|nr:glutamate-1-semialdehyde 2,1-aminomutase [Oscillospiraceae bacterium]